MKTLKDTPVLVEEYHDYACKQLRSRYYRVNGLRYGEFKSWYPSGNINLHCFYVNNLYHGEFKQMLSDGSVYSHRIYINDVFSSNTPVPHNDADKVMLTLKHPGLRFICN